MAGIGKIRLKSISTGIVMFDEEETITPLAAVCPCGSGDDYGGCCGNRQTCDCGSGQVAGECCYSSSGDDGYDPEEWN